MLSLKFKKIFALIILFNVWLFFWIYSNFKESDFENYRLNCEMYQGYS